MIDKKTLKRVNTIDSTNDYIKSHLSSLPNGFIISALHQEKGRGQRDRVWHSAKGKNLLFSFLIKDQLDHSYDLLYKTTVALTMVLNNHHLNPKIKLPNDLYINRKKLSGILIETVRTFEVTSYIVGVGLNVNEHFERSSLIATSMAQEAKHLFDIESLLLEFIDVFNQLNEASAFQTFKNHCMTLNHDVYLNGDVYELIDFSRDFTCTIAYNDTKKDLPCSQLKFDLND